MKKTIFTLIILVLSLSIFAEMPAVQVIQEKGKIDSLTIEYIKAFDEARFIYTLPASLFDKGDTIEKINQRVSLFTRENGYYFYNRIADDIIRYDNTKNLATYTATIKFK
ncbi:MAG: hypothetical protein E7064_02730 [Spirochaetaceae bacterium]|nr:hypothetical protein [Spirochaetaceae bacterium]